MSISVSSSISHGIAIDVATSSTATDETVTTSTTQNASLELQSTTDATSSSDEPAFLTISTEAIAVGENTLALTGIDALIISSDWASFITAEIDLLAAASTADGSLAFTSTGASLATGAASIAFVLTLDTTQYTSDGTNAISVSTSEVDLVAARIGGGPTSSENSDDTNSPTDIAETPIAPSASTADGLPTLVTDASTCDGPEFSLDGNVAIAEIFADAFGVDTFVDIAADVLAIEDQLSIILTEVILVAG